MTNSPYFPVFVLLLAGIGFAVAPLALAWLWAWKFSPRKPGSSKNSIYECGLESPGDAWIQFHPGYYLYAIIFLVFDVEAVFLLPFAVAFTGLTFAAGIAMLVFLLLLVEGLVWAYQKKVLVWS
ncbi:MAG TPA: NADH-quinone oxidoreductase subunit A [Acidobacteriaceae bacterium]|nr:NADH-quinone oxidoreductase subunit A [Acidobacteriaceae bacterium]